MAVLGEALFYRQDQVDLDAVLRNRGETGIRELVDALPQAAFTKHTDEELAADLMSKVYITPLTINLEEAKADVKEIVLETTNAFGERVRVKGLRATKAIPFKGDSGFWRLRTNPYDYNHPRGTVQGSYLVVGMEVSEQQQDQAVKHIDDSIRTIKEWLQRQEAQVSAFNSTLLGRVLPFLRTRRTSLSRAADLLKKLQS